MDIFCISPYCRISFLPDVDGEGEIVAEAHEERFTRNKYTTDPSAEGLSFV